MKPTRQALRELLGALTATAPTEIDCEEFVARVAPLVEHFAAQRELPPGLASALQHARVCPECREVYQALLEQYAWLLGESETRD